MKHCYKTKSNDNHNCFVICKKNGRKIFKILYFQSYTIKLQNGNSDYRFQKCYFVTHRFLLGIIYHIVRIVSAFTINNFAQDRYIADQSDSSSWMCRFYHKSFRHKTRLDIHPPSLVIKTKLRFSYNCLAG